MRLYKYKSLATEEERKYVARAIIDRELYCGDPSEFNDPFDCNIAVHLKAYLKELGVLCLSGGKADQVLMFSHYADRHRGLCLVFDVPDDGYIGKSSFLGAAQPVLYRESLPDLSDCHDGDRAREVVLTKYERWSYEDEYRVFSVLEVNPSPIRHYERGELSGVIFGHKMPAEARRTVRCWVKQGGHADVWFQEANLSDDSFSLEFTDC